MQKLSELKDSGVLTEEEFQRKKRTAAFQNIK
ncbi:MAG: SHOCT domain-containing protein [Oscillospiraceae bacterium]